jgi:hypothetical protein
VASNPAYLSTPEVSRGVGGPISRAQKGPSGPFARLPEPAWILPYQSPRDPQRPFSDGALGHDDEVNSCRAVLVGTALLVGWVGVAGASGSSSAPIKVRVALRHSRVVAGQPIKGTVILTNTTSRTFTVESCAQNGWLQIGLKGRGYTYRAISTLIACPSSIRLVPGANRFPVTVLTTYESCLQPGGESVTSLPACTSTGPPPLAAGRYSTTVYIMGLPQMTGAPRPMSVTLLRPMEPKKSPSSVPRCPNCPTHPAYGPTPIRR